MRGSDRNTDYPPDPMRSELKIESDSGKFFSFLILLLYFRSEYLIFYLINMLVKTCLR